MGVSLAAGDPHGIDGSLDRHRAWRDAGLPVDVWPELFMAWHRSLAP